jgi:dTMP kinase
MTARTGAGLLIAVDGVNGTRVRATADRELKKIGRKQRAGVSVWDASGVFGDLMVAGHEAGKPSARTLLLLYAADLAFRLRWEIRPALAEGRAVAAAPYVATAVAFGRAAGLPAGWLKNLFAFATRPDVARFVDSAPARKPRPDCFVDFASGHLAANSRLPTRRELTDRALALLKAQRPLL